MLACSCLPQTFEEKLQDVANIDAMYVFGQIKLVNGAFGGFVDPNTPVEDNDFPSDIYYYLAYNYKSWKGCGSPGSYEILVSSGSAGLCGRRLTSEWWIIGSRADFDQPQLRIDSCALGFPWSSFTYSQYNILENLPPSRCP